MILDFPAADPELQAIGRRLQRLRRERRVSLRALALRLEVPEPTLQKAERGRLRLTAAQLYAATLHLHIPMRLLFEDTVARATRPISAGRAPAHDPRGKPDDTR